MAQKRDKSQLKFEVSDFNDAAAGPVEERSCTDILCCLLFIVFWGGVWVVAGMAWQNGQPQYLAAVYDADGAACGLSAGYGDYKYIYWPVPLPSNFSSGVCVKSCPTYQNSSKPSSIDCKTNNHFSNCSERLTTSSQTMFLIYNTTLLLDRFCFPADAVIWSNSTYSSFANSILSDGASTFETYVKDAETVWPMYFAALGIALGFGLIFMIFMRWCSGIVTWLIILVFLAALGGLGGACYWQYDALKNGKSTAAEAASSSGGSLTSTYNTLVQNQNVMIGFAITFWALAGVLLLMVCCWFTQIRLAIAILKSAATFVTEVPTVLITPLIKTVMLGCFIAFWIVVFIYAASMGTFSNTPGTPFVTVTWDEKTRYVLLYWIFTGCWNVAFIMALAQFIIASCAAIWYFGQASNQVHAPLSRSFYRAFRYHLGSLAFGSLIIAIIQTIRVVLAYVQKQMQSLGQENRCTKCLFSCAQCCLACFERFMEFLNKNAYIQIAIKGSNFCTAAKDAFFLIWTNPARFAVLGGIGAIFLFIGKGAISIGTAVLGYTIITNNSTYSTAISSPLLPTILFFVIGYTIGTVIISVYGMGADTILQCYCLDEEIHAKNSGAPKYAPAPLREFITSVDNSHQPVQTQQNIQSPQK